MHYSPMHPLISPLATATDCFVTLIHAEAGVIAISCRCCSLCACWHTYASSLSASANKSNIVYGCNMSFNFLHLAQPHCAGWNVPARSAWPLAASWRLPTPLDFAAAVVIAATSSHHQFVDQPSGKLLCPICLSVAGDTQQFSTPICCLNSSKVMSWLCYC